MRVCTKTKNRRAKPLCNRVFLKEVDKGQEDVLVAHEEKPICLVDFKQFHPVLFTWRGTSPFSGQLSKQGVALTRFFASSFFAPATEAGINRFKNQAIAPLVISVLEQLRQERKVVEPVREIMQHKPEFHCWKLVGSGVVSCRFGLGTILPCSRNSLPVLLQSGLHFLQRYKIQRSRFLGGIFHKWSCKG